ncbi:MAG TPA: hypothetical protein VFS43_46445 [Polyangiaceae bacterium]|nr:hypothetical protein [Polyangiaceae bacterium]
MRGGLALPADAVVLATGRAPRVRRAAWHPGVVDAWDECALATLPRGGRLLLVGAGLSALDVVAFLDAQGFEGRVTIVSRHGLLSSPHEDVAEGQTPLLRSLLEGGFARRGSRRCAKRSASSRPRRRGAGATPSRGVTRGPSICAIALVM